jgi:hypothetical protein
MRTAVLLAPLAVLLEQVLARDELQIVPVMTTIGVLAAVVQFLGLARRPFLVPALAGTYLNPDSSPARGRQPSPSSTHSTGTSASQSADASAPVHRNVDDARRRSDAAIVKAHRPNRPDRLQIYVQARAGHSQGSITERYMHAAQVLFPGAAEKSEARMFGDATQSDDQ